ncbi:MAG: hypothetical protein UT33_C0012G0061 [Candidatus Peregrinibacteria bacterium GW2011_GWC2_39_14]|nr:MAG: hypothetical protein US92_C0003G0088 [Candidatus Peregrinibacteria bacterium GW2011_GWA2_38_36]KKR05256.1 MAG: hypothetical protein UT33_C0012G0061 [Candidatus Peregrinibacteria bacterium GW2011_GWC2_39_14]
MGTSPDSPDPLDRQAEGGGERKESLEAAFLRMHPGATIMTRDVYGHYCEPGSSIYANERTSADFNARMGRARVGYYLDANTRRVTEVIEWIETCKVRGRFLWVNDL